MTDERKCQHGYGIKQGPCPVCDDPLSSRSTLNELLFNGTDGLEACYDRPCIEIAWDQWSRTRITCKHGVFEGVSDFMDLLQGVERAMESFRKSVATGVHYKCRADTPVPESWIVPYGYAAGDMTDCDLVRDHDGPHHCFPDDETENAYWANRRVYYVNDHLSKRVPPSNPAK